MPRHRSASLDRAGRWLLDSGIRDAQGGVARFYRTDTAEYARVSSEITGYAAAALAWLYTRTGDGRYLEAALASGRFLTRVAWDASLRTLPFELLDNGEGFAYFFDLGIAGRALLRLWRASGETEFRDAAVACAESMARDFDAGAGFHAIVALPSKQPLPRDRRWSRSPGCYQLKAALVWYEIAADLGCAGMRGRYESLLAYALRDANRFMTGEPEHDRMMDRLHALCYFLEGLLPCAERPDCAAALSAGIERVELLFQVVGREFERSDVRAQLLRARLYAAALGALPIDKRSAEVEAADIAFYQAAGASRAEDGGYLFGRRGAELLPHVNPVSTMFSMQTLEMWRDYQAARFDPDWRALV